MANKLELQIEVDSSGAVKGLQFVQGKAKETADAVSHSFGNTSFDKFSESVKRGIEDPLGAAGEAAKGFLSALGPMGTGLAAGVAVFGAFATAGFEAAKALGEYGDQLEDTATRMGLSVKETAQFSFAMKYAGGSIESLEGSMRVLSQALSEETEDGKKAKKGLTELGIEARDSSGHLRPMAQIFTELSEKLGGIEDVAKRNTIAIQVLGRAGLQVLPDLLELSEGIKRANEIGIKGPSEAELAKWKQYHHQVVEFETEWAKLKRETMQPLAAVVTVTMKYVTEGLGNAGRMLSVPGTIIGGMLSGNAERPTPDTPNIIPGVMGPVPTVEDRARLLHDESSKAIIAPILKRWGMSKEGLDAALSEAKKNESEALGKLKSGDASAIADFNKAQGQVSSIEAKLKALSETTKAFANVNGLIEKYNVAVQSPLRKLMIELDADTKKVAPGDRDALQSAGLNAILREQAKIKQKEAEDAQKAADEMSAAFAKVDDTIREMMSSTSAFGGDSNTGIARTLGTFGPTQASADQRISSMQAAESAQERIVQLMTGAGGELAAISQISAMRQSLAQQELEERSKGVTDALTLFNLQFDHEQKLQQIRSDNAIQILELRKRQEDEYVNAVKGGFRALVSGGRSGLGSFVGSQLMGFGETALGNVTRMGYEKVQGSIPGFSSDSLGGKIFAGLPIVKAGDIQLTAAQMQYKAATVFAGAVTGGAPGNVLSMPFGGVVGELFNHGFGGGVSRTNPFIFSANTLGTPDIAGIPGTGTAGSPALNGMYNKTPYYNGKPLSTTAKAVGVAGAVAGGAIGTYEGIQQGGAKGALTAAGSLAGAAGTIMALSPMAGPAAPILAGVGLALGLSTMLFGDPKKKYAESEGRMLDSAKYTAPDSSTYTFDKSGKAFDYDLRGNMRTYVTNNYNISAMDAQSFHSFAERNSDTFAETIRKAIPNHGGLRLGIQNAVMP